MFVTVGALTHYMDDTIRYFQEGIASKEQHDVETYDRWYASITSTMQGQLKKLKKISSNQKLIEKYEKLIDSLLHTN